MFDINELFNKFGMNQEIWRCSQCYEQFTPSHGLIECPKCGSVFVFREKGKKNE
jgi:DNA-directed RNA polymerase subunit RPC12/RpoP